MLIVILKRNANSNAKKVILKKKYKKRYANIANNNTQNDSII